MSLHNMRYAVARTCFAFPVHACREGQSCHKLSVMVAPPTQLVNAPLLLRYCYVFKRLRRLQPHNTYPPGGQYSSHSRRPVRAFGSCSTWDASRRCMTTPRRRALYSGGYASASMSGQVPCWMAASLVPAHAPAWLGAWGPCTDGVGASAAQLHDGNVV